jgi:hypothetical protein
MLHDRPMAHLRTAYDRLPQLREPERLAGHYRDALRAAEGLVERREEHPVTSPIARLATAVPPCDSVNVAIHLIHALPADAGSELANELLGSAARWNALALSHCHRALELDGQAHGYTADEWLPGIIETAAALLDGADPGREPPALVGHAQDAVRWLSQAIVELDRDGPDAAAAIVDGLARLLSVEVFITAARQPGDEQAR